MNARQSRRWNHVKDWSLATSVRTMCNSKESLLCAESQQEHGKRSFEKFKVKKWHFYYKNTNSILVNQSVYHLKSYSLLNKAHQYSLNARTPLSFRLTCWQSLLLNIAFHCSIGTLWRQFLVPLCRLLSRNLKIYLFDKD